MSRAKLPEPPDELKRLSRGLSGLIRDLIRHEGPVPFSRYMDMALYQPGLGYYSAGLHKLGEDGDFVTSPELGSLFAGCLARQIDQVAAHLGAYDILEIGAGTGRLAGDILQSLAGDRLPQRYLILDRSADLRQVQKERFSNLSPELKNRIEWLDRPPTTPWRGILVANEVLDALAVERFEITPVGVQQLCVDEGPGGFTWSLRDAPAELANRVGALELDVTPGFRSEINLHTTPWLESLTASMAQGLALFIDYGYPRREYYLPQRRDGTLMCHYRQRAHDDVFFWPGLQDITAWVDFTALAEAADECGLDVEGYCNQAMFLMGCGLEQVLAAQVALTDDAGLALNAQARQLTLPGMMGERFQVMGLGRGLDFPLAGFSLQDLSYRL
jgi:SAM-dependent MidA family methyltransferase